MHSIRLSAIIITHNEETMLPDCLKSIHWVNEIIILDHKSKDKTCHIAKTAGAYVYHSKKWEGFGKQRQLAQRYATGDYILTLDADERVSSQLKKSIISILQKQINNNIVYSFTRRNFFIKHWMQHSGWYPDFVIRLYPKNFFYNSMKVHEKLKTNHATIKKLQGELLHITCQDLFKFQKKQLQYAKIWASENVKKTHKKHNLFKIIIHSIGTFLKIFFLNLAFLDGKYGLLLAIIKTQYTFNKYSILWSIQKNNNTLKKPTKQYNE